MDAIKVHEPHDDLASLIHQIAEINGNAPAILSPEAPVLDYAGVGRLVSGAKARLRDYGIGQHDIVAVALPNGPEMATGCRRSRAPPGSSGYRS